MYNMKMESNEGILIIELGLSYSFKSTFQW